MEQSFFERLRRRDNERRSFPGEHWLALAAGLWFLRRQGGSLAARLSSKAIGAGLLYRAASGRDGLRRLIGRDSRQGAEAGSSASSGELSLESPGASSSGATGGSSSGATGGATGTSQSSGGGSSPEPSTGSPGRTADSFTDLR